VRRAYGDGTMSSPDATNSCREERSVSVEENKALVRRFVEAQANADLDTLDELLAPDFVDHSLQADQEPGREGFMQSAAEEHAIFSNVRVHIEDQAAEGDKVTSRLTIKRIHDRREFMGVAPTGMELKATAIVIHRIAEGKILEEWSEGTGLLEATRQRLEQERIERERIEQDLRVARTIQQASLPKEVPDLEGWQINPYCQPAREVGGDFYDFHHLSEGRVGLVVGDATGKGVPAALVMTGVCAFLGGVATASGSSSPGEVLAQVNEALSARIPPNMFVTCFYAILEPKSGHLSYANAGHTLPCCKRHNEDQADELVARGMPLGLMTGMTYEEKETTLVPGDVVFFCTDGLVEAHNSQGEMFGIPRLRGILSERSEGRRELSAALMEELERFTGEGWEQEDDVTLLTLKCSAT
jgi:serine phosphatase RsbU (regulator of sigma subunit)/predicted ester cyclase